MYRQIDFAISATMGTSPRVTVEVGTTQWSAVADPVDSVDFSSMFPLMNRQTRKPLWKKASARPLRELPDQLFRPLLRRRRRLVQVGVSGSLVPRVAPDGTSNRKAATRDPRRDLPAVMHRPQ